MTVPETARPGTVYVVGAGPGDPGLLTVAAKRLLDSADVVLHDSLVGEGVVDAIPEAVTVVPVGKRPDGERTTQAEINRRLVREARRERAVVRLKGGDPTVFGRGGEEAEYLAARDVPFEVVPGVTSAVAAPAAAGVPLTHRDHASSVTVVTGHEAAGKASSALDWDALADSVTAGGTLVVLMGVGGLPDVVAALRERGVAGDTPAATVERATLPGEFAVRATLDALVERVRETGVEPPAVTVVGDVVSVADRVEDALGAPAGVAAAGGAVAEATEWPVAEAADGALADGGRATEGPDSETPDGEVDRPP